ncbi:MAG: hypothetical protein JST26_07355 [Bacteroidetes bacterium]|nr:hypothetical protein [Bacteroidota bacterium]
MTGNFYVGMMLASQQTMFFSDLSLRPFGGQGFAEDEQSGGSHYAFKTPAQS